MCNDTLILMRGCKGVSVKQRGLVRDNQNIPHTTLEGCFYVIQGLKKCLYGDNNVTKMLNAYRPRTEWLKCFSQSFMQLDR